MSEKSHFFQHSMYKTALRETEISGSISNPEHLLLSFKK